MPSPAPYDTLFIDEAQNRLVPLPTPNDIDGSGDLLYDSPSRRVVKIHHRFAIKFGIHVQPMEAKNMLFVAKSTTVPIPKVYAIYQVRETEGVSTFIVMQYLPGTTLQNLWDSMDHARKKSIARTLRTYFDELRQLQHPGYFGNIEGGPLADDMFTLTPGGKEIKKPFATEDELIKGIIRIYELETGERMAHKTRYYKHVLPTVLRGTRGPTFSHGDFQRKNVMVQPDGTIYIIDWEFASWYPDYWEYACATFASGGWRDDWHEYVRMALDEFPNQSLWLSNMKIEMWS
ncbi:hypothetical protein DL769_002660 [Monosporascus sp. CRB-8-3]|nr:hypothetical protein DL769_002660 [Monosporascus sp. CRB-8-3]